MSNAGDEDWSPEVHLQHVHCICPESGSHIWHCAQQSETGKRLTMVTSFYVDSPSAYDSSSMRVSMIYSPPVDYIWQYIRHIMTRLSKNANAIAQALLDGNEIAGAWTVLNLEVAKLHREYWEMSQLLDEASSDDRCDESEARDAFSTFASAVSTVQKCLHPVSHTKAPPERQIPLCLGLAETAETILSSVAPLVKQHVEESLDLQPSARL